MPFDVRLTKIGNVFAAYQLANGAWQQTGSVTATMGTNFHVGLAIYAMQR